MQQNLILDIVQSFDEAIFAVDLNGKIIFWNKGAEGLFGYKTEEVIRRSIPFIKKDSKYELKTAFEKAEQGERLVFKTQKKDKKGNLLNLVIIVAPLHKENELVGLSFFAKEIDTLKKATFIHSNFGLCVRGPKRTFKQIRNIILVGLRGDKMTINQIASETGINWKTVEKHLTFMIGRKLVEEIFSSEYVRIFELTGYGKEYVDRLKENELSNIVKKD